MKPFYDIGRYVYYVNNIDEHLQKIAEKFSAIGDYWFPVFLIKGRLVSLLEHGTLKRVPLFIEIGKYGEQIDYDPEKGFITHKDPHNALNALIHVGLVDVKAYSNYYIDEDGWEGIDYNIRVSNWIK